MTTIVDMVRHAQSQMNLDRSLVGGRSNQTPLSPEGERSARALGERLVAAGYRPDAVVCSGAVRSRRTAELVCRAADWGPIEVEDGLLELSQGSAEGQPRDQWWTPHQVEVMRADPLHHRLAPDGESHAEVQQRIRAALVAIAARHPGQTVLAVGHGVAMRTLRWSLVGGSHDDGFRRQELDNLGHIRFEVDPVAGTVRLAQSASGWPDEG